MTLTALPHAVVVRLAVRVGVLAFALPDISVARVALVDGAVGELLFHVYQRRVHLLLRGVIVADVAAEHFDCVDEVDFVF